MAQIRSQITFFLLALTFLHLSTIALRGATFADSSEICFDHVVVQNELTQVSSRCSFCEYLAYIAFYITGIDTGGEGTQIIQHFFFLHLCTASSLLLTSL